MLKRMISAVVVMCVCLGIAMAEEIRGAIFKVDGNKITFAKVKKGEKLDEQTLTVVKDVKVIKGKYNKETKSLDDPRDVDGGLKHKMFAEIGEKGVGVIIVTNDAKKVTEIRVIGGGKKKQQ